MENDYKQIRMQYLISILEGLYNNKHIDEKIFQESRNKIIKKYT